VVLGTILALAISGTAFAAFQTLPTTGGQVNGDSGNGIDPARPVSTEDPANSDVTGGSLTGGVAVPWATFRQSTAGSDQIFVRAFKSGAWATQGSGTTNGASSASPIFPASLNFDQSADGKAPSIDFAGTNRAVPWATWYESSTPLGNHDEIFASRFDTSSGKWVFSGQGRTLGSASPPAVPSLNIHTNHDAENPVVAGGSTADATKPGPWIAWQETDDSTAGPTQGPDQIFVSKPVAGATNCDTVKPAGVPDNPPVTGDVPAIGGFCFQQVGIEREPSGGDVSPATSDPSLNVDPTRDGIEPDITFTGPNDAVPWVVWYETGTGSLGLSAHELVFAAKGVADGSADGGFHWTAVGNTGSGTLDTAGAVHSLGACAETLAAEEACSLNSDPTTDAEDPRVAAGTMTAGNPTVPWVVWDEFSNGHERVFVSRLVNGQFALANGGQPLPTLVSGIDAVRPDISFSGNTPYVTWHEGSSIVSGHFTSPTSFTIDNGAVGTNSPSSVRAPISSGCTGDPFNGDGASCQAGAVGTPFFLFTDGSTPRLFADAYQTDAPVTGAASQVTTSSAVLAGSVNPQGAPVEVRFQYGTSPAYGQSTALKKLPPSNTAAPFTAALTGLPAGATIHYRAEAITDFGVRFGADGTLTTASPPPPPDTTPPSLHLSIGKITLKKLLKAKKLKVKITVSEAASVAGSASTRVKRHRKTKTVALGKFKTTMSASGSKVVSLKLTSTGLRALRHLTSAKITVKGRATDHAGNTSPTRSTSRTLKRG
jgi:hypothetical protein